MDRRGRKLATVAVVTLVFCGMLVAAFGVGLYAGARRTGLFEFVKNLKLRVDSALGRGDGSAGDSATPERMIVLDAAAIAEKQASQKPPADLQDWAGFYRMVTAAKDLGGFKPLNPYLPSALEPRLQPWARAKREATDGVADDTGQICQPVGMLRMTGGFAAGILLLPSADKVVMAYWPIELGGVQRVYLNRVHPRNLLPTWNGDSIGFWDGDTLVVDTIGFNDKSWLHSTMEPHTEEAHAIQRVRRVGGGAYLEVHYTVEDRKALTSAYAYSRYFKRVRDDMPEDVCNEDVQIFRDFRDEALAAQLERARRIR